MITVGQLIRLETAVFPAVYDPQCQAVVRHRLANQFLQRYPQVELAFRDQVIEGGVGVGKNIMETPFSVLPGFIVHGGPVRRSRSVYSYSVCGCYITSGPRGHIGLMGGA